MPRSLNPPPVVRSIRFVWWLPVLMLLLACMAFPSHAQQYSIRHHDQTQGLDNLVVTALAQDADGFLWVGTENGLYRYDGAAFRHVSLAGDAGIRRIHALHIDKSGHVWVGTSHDLYVLTAGRAAAVRHQGMPVPVGLGQMLASDAQGRVLVVSKGKLFVVQPRAGGAWEIQPLFSDTRSSHPQAATSVTSVHADAGGAVWFGCGAALCRAAGEAVDVFHPPKELGAASWSAIFKDSRGDLWLRSASRLLVLPAQASAFVDRTPQRLHTGQPLLSTPVVEDRYGRVLTVGDGNLRRWDGQHWSTVDAGNGLEAGGSIAALLADRDGGLWIGTAGLGLAQWVGYSHFASWTAREGLAGDEVWAFGRDRLGNFHVGTIAGVSRRRGGDGQRFEPELGQPLLQATGSVAEDRDGYLWYGDSAGTLVRVHPRTQQVSKVATLPVILKIFVDSAGRIWVLTKQGIFLFEPRRDGSFSSRRVDETVNPDPVHGPRSLDACETASGLLWFATDAGLLAWTDGQLQRVPLHRADGESFVPTDFGTLACSDGSQAWTGGPESQGVWRVQWTGHAAEITDVTPPHLKERSVMGVLQDRRGWLWVSTDYGVSVWNRTRWRSFSQDSGLAWNDCNQGALYEDADGSIWIGTVRGATRIEHVDSIFDTASPRAAIASITRGPQRLDTTAPLRLDWDRAPLNIAFTSPAYEDRRLIRFHYRMVGLHDAWSSAAGSELTFAPLPPGRYTLQVRAQNTDSRAESEVVSLDLDVAPPWWRTLPFYAVCAGTLLLAAWSLHAWRLARVARRQQELEHIVIERTAELRDSREQLRELSGHNARALEDERKHVSRELHDEMGQQLAALRMEVSVLGMRSRAHQPPGSEHMDMLLGRVDRLVTSVRGLVSQLRPPALDGGLPAALDWLADEFTRSTGTPCQVDVDTSVGELASDQATMVFRIAQESLTNVRRHAKAAHVALQLRRNDGAFVLSVSDNGVGFAATSPRAGYGLLGMQERARLLGGELTIISAPGEGTTVRLRVAPALPQPA